jgi:hypothetical protein
MAVLTQCYNAGSSSPFPPVRPTGPCKPWIPVMPCGPASPVSPLGPWQQQQQQQWQQQQQQHKVAVQAPSKCQQCNGLVHNIVMSACAAQRCQQHLCLKQRHITCYICHSCTLYLWACGSLSRALRANGTLRIWKQHGMHQQCNSS